MSSVGTAVRLPLGSPGSGIELARFDPKRVQPGFAHVNRYFDRLLDHVVVKILPGEYYVTTQGEAVVTVLGSCVSACIRDRRSGIGGMNHFMLPESFPGEVATANGRGERYGNIAMEQLVNSVLKAGGDRRELEVKVFGGGRVLAQMTDVGKRNPGSNQAATSRTSSALTGAPLTTAILAPSMKIAWPEPPSFGSTVSTGSGCTA